MGGGERGGQWNTAVHQALSGRRYRLGEGPPAAAVAAGRTTGEGGEKLLRQEKQQAQRAEAIR